MAVMLMYCEPILAAHTNTTCRDTANNVSTHHDFYARACVSTQPICSPQWAGWVGWVGWLRWLRGLAVVGWVVGWTFWLTCLLADWSGTVIVFDPSDAALTSLSGST